MIDIDRLLNDRERLVQAVAEICGEFSLDAAGTIFRVVEPLSLAMMRGEADCSPRVYEVKPERAEGIYQSIAARLLERPEYQPLAEANRIADRASALYANSYAEAARLRKALEAQVVKEDGAGPHCMLCDGRGIDVKHGRDCPLRP
jgi:hypothetical protein